MRVWFLLLASVIATSAQGSWKLNESETKDFIAECSKYREVVTCNCMLNWFQQNRSKEWFDIYFTKWKQDEISWLGKQNLKLLANKCNKGDK